MTGSTVAVQEILVARRESDREASAPAAEPARPTNGTFGRVAFMSTVVAVQLAWLAVLAYGIQLLA